MRKEKVARELAAPNALHAWDLTSDGRWQLLPTSGWKGETGNASTTLLSLFAWFGSALLRCALKEGKPPKISEIHFWIHQFQYAASTVLNGCVQCVRL